MTMKDEEELPDGMFGKRLEPEESLKYAVELQSKGGGTTSDPRHRAGTDKAVNRLCEPVVQFKYDYARRRVEKKVIDDWTGTSGTTISHLKYVYDGHNLIAELNASNNTVLSTYVLGLDLSGTNWGAGGVGGLLMIKDGSKVYFPGFDGNGNVSPLVDSADGSLDAKYEYGAFGEPLRVGGTSIAADNPFRFSTKYTDTDGARQRVDGDAEGVARRAEEAGAPWALMRQTGLVYYGFRYYSPSLGRFLNRDPLGELGGSNLYGFVENDPVNGWDYLGYGMDYIGGPGCESKCRSYMAEFMYRSFEECMRALCPGELEPYIVEEEDDIEELEEYIVEDVAVPEPYMGLGPGPLIGGDGDGGYGDDSDGGGASGEDGCDEEKEKEEKTDCLGAKDPDTGIITPVRDKNGESVLFPPNVDFAQNMKIADENTAWYKGPISNGKWLISMVDYGHPWDYKALTPDARYEPFGNFHYGVVGRASGFSGRRLLREAGRAQVVWDTSKGNPLQPGNPGWQWNPFGGTAPYGDYQEDQFMIDQGVDAYNTDVEYVRIPCEE